jgi:hypothetical protein
MKNVFRWIVCFCLLVSIVACKKEKNQPKTIQLENLVWNKIEEGLTLNIIDVGSELYLAKQNQVLKSTDMGNTWTKLGWPTDINIIGGMVYSPQKKQLIIGTRNSGWYSSVDKGVSFQASGPSALNTGSADIISLSNGQLIATQGGSLRGLYKANVNTPLNWRQTFSGVDFTSIAKITDDTIYACGIGAPAIVKSFDGGETWITVENKNHAVDYITSFGDSIMVVHRWGTISAAKVNNAIDLYAVRSSIAGNMFHYGDYAPKDTLLIVTASENGIYLSKDNARNFKYQVIPGVKTYIRPKIIGDYLFVNTDAGLYRAQFKF